MSANGEAIINPASSPGLAHYPQARLAPSGKRTLYVSGITARRADGSIGGVDVGSEGNVVLNIEGQTTAIFENIDAIIKQATDGQGGLGNIIDATIFLIDLKKDYAGMNAVWNRYFQNARVAPARTCVGVRDLPSPKLIVELKVTALID